MGKKASPNKGKGKALPSPSAATPVELDLISLAQTIALKAHLLVPGQGDADLALQALETLKKSFDHALSSESSSFPLLSNLLSSLSPSNAPVTRAAAAAAAKAPPPPTHVVEPTPLESLTIEEMDPEMIWAQMEMRNENIVELLEEFLGGDDEEDDGEGGEGSDEEEEEEEEEIESEDGEEEDFEEQEPFYRKLGPESSDVEMEDAVDDDEEEDEDEDVLAREKEDPLMDPTASLSLSTFDRPSSLTRPSSSRRALPSAVDDQFFSLEEFHRQVDEGEFEMSKALRSSADAAEDGDDDDDEEDEGAIDLFKDINTGGGSDDEEEDLDVAGIMYKDFFEPPPRPYIPSGGKKPKSNSKGKEIAKDPSPSSSKAITNVASTPTKLKRSVRFSSAVKVKHIPNLVKDHFEDELGYDISNDDEEEGEKAITLSGLESQVGKEKAKELWQELLKEAAEGEEDEDEDEDFEEGDEDSDSSSEDEEDEQEDGEEGEMELMGSEDEEDEDGEGEFESEDEEGMETIERLKTDLFDEEAEEAAEGLSEAAQLSRHERRLLALSSQIAALEAENVGVKDWATRGEAKAKDRPVNSLLEEDLEYERSGKVVPVITEETTKTIEDLIKKRILDNQFDDVVRIREVDPNAFLPSRYMDLQDTKSGKSLAELYEDEFTEKREREEGRKVVNELDKDLEEKHREIEELFEDLRGKLDALSNARFTPKPPKATITTISNVPSVSLESALPTTSSTSTLLAPEEIFVPDPTNEDRSSYTPAQKRLARQKRRKARASLAQKAEKFGSSKGLKGEKEKATKELVGTRGVTVLGKGGKSEKGKGVKRKRDAGDEGEGSAVRLKL